MARKILDLSHTLKPLTKELQDTVSSLCVSEKSHTSLFGASIDSFIHKYGSSAFNSLDELLDASLITAQYIPSTTASLGDLLEDLIAK